MKVDFINSSYRRFYQSHKKEIDEAITGCYERGDFILREEVDKFEKKLANYLGVKYAVGVNSGTDAIRLAMEALGITQLDEVITVSNTFIASIEEIVHLGATPVLLDVREDGLMDVEKLEKAITPLTKAIQPVHLYGKVCDMDKIMEIAKKYNLFVVEDSCQALGANYGGKKAGTFGNAGCFSFIAPKLLGAGGDGGAIVTDDKDLYAKLVLLRNHWNISQNALLGLDIKRPEIMGWGWNSRFDNIHAAVVNVKFKYIEEILNRRKEIGEMYNEGLEGLPLKLPLQQTGQVYQEYVIQLLDEEERVKFADFMAKKEVELLIRDIVPNHKLKGLGLEHFNLPVTERMAKTSVRLPIAPELHNEEIEYIVNSIKEFYA